MAINLANFAKENKFDGVDVDYEDNAAMEARDGANWLIAFTQKLRS